MLRTDGVDWQEDDTPYGMILYLSVHHQFDPTYERLEGTLQRLMARSDSTVVELIDPPLEGSHCVRATMEGLGFQQILSYDHKVRRHRTLWMS